MTCARCECTRCQSEREARVREGAILQAIFKYLEHEHRREVGTVRAWEREGLGALFGTLLSQERELRKHDASMVESQRDSGTDSWTVRDMPDPEGNGRASLPGGAE